MNLNLFGEVIIFKNELLQSSIAKTPENHSERLIGYLESQILLLQRELKENYRLLKSLLEQMSKCSDIIEPKQELTKITNVKPFENKTLIKQNRFIEATTTTNEESKNSGEKELNDLKRKVKNVILNKTQVLVVVITTNPIKQIVISHQHQKLIIKRIINKI